MDKNELAKILYDSNYRPPYYFVECLLEENTLWRTTMKGEVEYLRGEARFDYLFNYSPKSGPSKDKIEKEEDDGFRKGLINQKKVAELEQVAYKEIANRVSLKDRIDALIKYQDHCLFVLSQIEHFPFMVDAIAILAENIFRKPETEFSQDLANKDLFYWYLFCVSGQMLRFHFGGQFVKDKKHRVVVRLGKASVDVYLFSKIYGAKPNQINPSSNFSQWFYELSMRLYNHVERSMELNFSDLDCVRVREKLNVTEE